MNGEMIAQQKSFLFTKPIFLSPKVLLIYKSQLSSDSSDFTIT